MNKKRISIEDITQKVLINSQTEDQSEIFHSVAIDDRLGARLATEHLISLGHTAIGYLGVDDRSQQVESAASRRISNGSCKS